MRVAISIWQGPTIQRYGPRPEVAMFCQERPGRDSMRAVITHKAKTSGPVALKLLFFVALLVPALTVIPQSAFATTSSDDFNRADGGLGVNWTDMTDGGLAVSAGQVVGTSSGASGDIRTAETTASDQYSQIEITSTQLSGGQWVGPAVRAQNGGQNVYLGLYWWNFGSPELMLFKRISGGWTQLGSAYGCGALAAGTQLQLAVTGSNLTFLENGVARITTSDTSLTGGAPAIMAYGAATADNWTGGDSSSSLPPADTPEVPVVVLFPIVATGLMGVFVVYRRRRTSRV